AAGEPAAGGPRLHPLTDCIIEFQMAEAVPSDRLLATSHAFRRVGSKPVVIEGSTTATDEPGQSSWAPLAARQRLFRVRVGVLLANRHGPLNAMEYSEFVTGVQALAEQLAVLGDTPDMNAILQRARSLDESCAALDAQIGLNVDAPDALSLVDLARLAHETGCVERGNNRHARLTEHGEVVFSLSLSDVPTRLSLLLDVPRAPLGAQPWPEMVACARHCAQRLGGRLVDDQGRALTDVSLERIEQQLTERQQALSSAGLVPGSTLALRVFN
ncbi:MAG TPA: cell division protein ZipA C-terminal FtsZ-binding domain-containing protein, partial [Burkholderiaceae bacterium]|nr:cell division protein ZipA C-terminal FtsZ-binding domain-containing protein [Burkholderiaceae bacterium]